MALACSNDPLDIDVMKKILSATETYINALEKIQNSYPLSDIFD